MFDTTRPRRIVAEYLIRLTQCKRCSNLQISTHMCKANTWPAMFRQPHSRKYGCRFPSLIRLCEEVIIEGQVMHLSFDGIGSHIGYASRVPLGRQDSQSSTYMMCASTILHSKELHILIRICMAAIIRPLRGASRVMCACEQRKVTLQPSHRTYKHRTYLVTMFTE